MSLCAEILLGLGRGYMFYNSRVLPQEDMCQGPIRYYSSSPRRYSPGLVTPGFATRFDVYVVFGIPASYIT